MLPVAESPTATFDLLEDPEIFKTVHVAALENVGQEPSSFKLEAYPELRFEYLQSKEDESIRKLYEEAIKTYQFTKLFIPRRITTQNSKLTIVEDPSYERGEGVQTLLYTKGNETAVTEMANLLWYYGVSGEFTHERFPILLDGRIKLDTNPGSTKIAAGNGLNGFVYLGGDTALWALGRRSQFTWRNDPNLLANRKRLEIYEKIVQGRERTHTNFIGSVDLSLKLEEELKKNASYPHTVDRRTVFLDHSEEFKEALKNLKLIVAYQETAEGITVYC